MTGGRSSPGMDPAGAAAAVLLPEVGSILSLWEGEARVEPACDAPPSRASRGRLAGVRGPGNLHSHVCGDSTPSTSCQQESRCRWDPNTMLVSNEDSRDDPQGRQSRVKMKVRIGPFYH